ncbi:UPF0104 family protein [Vreelandella rituensis]|uniref:UPF0104 family protein n=1 Tax=Vreelandella rituensis TaxID=2282306 RepID=A0A368U7H8_9GAMM|nr:UPF0104 family protein [Halomonas rituensis]
MSGLFWRPVASLIVLAGLFLWVSPQQVFQEIRGLAPAWVILALVLSGGQVALSAWRWWLTARCLKVPLGYAHALKEYYLGLLVNQLLPGGVVGDAGRAWRHAQHSRARGSAWRAVIIERTSGQMAVVILTLAALLASPVWHAVLGSVGLVVLLALSALLIVALRWGLRKSRLSQHGGPRWWQALRQDIQNGLLRPGIWPQQLGASLLVVFSYGLVMLCAARAIGADISSTTLLALTPPLLLAMLIPFSIAGWGLREGAAAAVWALVGLPPAQGVAISLAYGVLVLLASLPGVCFMLRHPHRPVGSPGGQKRHIEQGVVTAGETTHRGAQGGVQRLDGRQGKPRAPRADQQRCDQQMQVVNHAGLDEARNGNAATFDQDAFQPVCGQGIEHGLRLEVALGIQRQTLSGDVPGGVGVQADVVTDQVQRSRGAVLQYSELLRSAATGVENDANGTFALNMTHAELRIVGTGGTHADDHGIHQCPQAVQVDQALWAVDVVRMAALRGDAPIQTLPQLREYQPLCGFDQRRQAFKQRNRFLGKGSGSMPLARYGAGQCKRRWLATMPREQPVPGLGR